MVLERTMVIWPRFWGYPPLWNSLLKHTLLFSQGVGTSKMVSGGIHLFGKLFVKCTFGLQRSLSHVVLSCRAGANFSLWCCKFAGFLKIIFHSFKFLLTPCYWVQLCVFLCTWDLHDYEEF